MSKLSLNTPIDDLPMVGPTYAKRLEKLEIRRVEDLLYHFPHRHEDSSTILPIAAIKPGMQATIKGTVVSAKNIRTKRGKQLQKAIIADESGQIDVVWFNQPYLVTTLNKAHQIQLSGKADFFGPRLSMTSPSYEVIKEEGSGSTIHTGGLIPVYPETYGVSSKWLRSRISPLIKNIHTIIESDFLPNQTKTSQKLINLTDALKQIHFPNSQKELEEARYRLAFDELFLLQLASQKRKLLWQQKSLSHPLTIYQDKILDFISHLPFTLTKAQNQSIKEILQDLESKTPMNRLLQGDVGSGKTVVAATAIYATHLNGLNSILLAPTEILANQHYYTLKSVLEPLGVNMELVTGSTNTLKQSLQKQTDLLIGTHALLYRDIPDDTGLLIVDEQHRFGVEQRAKLLKGSKTPHLLSMTATPIPRTVALTAYGELDLSIIDEMPEGRKTVKTWVVPKQKRAGAYDWIQDKIKTDKIQAFVVCPLIEESASERFSQVKSVETEFKNLKSVFPKLNIDMLHGRMKSVEKEKVIKKFKAKKSHILVSTPVIEVGIDIPNANIMIIEAAERFGLAGLHQLRGRIGRGDQQSYCLLFTTSNSSQDSARLKAMQDHHSGFKLAEIDLKLRGPGEMYGLRQHGYASLKIADFSDENLIKTTHQEASKILKSDPKLESVSNLKNKLELLMDRNVEPN